MIAKNFLGRMLFKDFASCFTSSDNPLLISINI